MLGILPHRISGAVVVLISLDHQSLHVDRRHLLQGFSVSVGQGMGVELELLIGRNPHSVFPVLSVCVLVCYLGVLSHG